MAVGTLARPSPASAHEFALPLVLPTEPGASADGPDMGHPAGADAGDHLGDVDVDIVVIEPCRRIG